MSEATGISLADVFIANRARLRHIALRIVRTAEQADDVVQDAYLRLVDGPAPRQVARPFCYCCQVVRNLALDCCRRHTVEANYRTYGVDVELLEVHDSRSPYTSVRDKQVLLAIDQALSHVPTRTRHVFELYRLEGLTQRQIAERVGCALGLVNAMIAEAARAIERCHHLLDDGWRAASRSGRRSRTAASLVSG